MDAGVVDEDVEPSERACRLVDNVRPAALAGDIVMHEQRSVAELTGECLAHVIGEIGEDHRSTLGAEAPRV